MARLIVGIAGLLVLAAVCHSSSPPPDFNGRPRGVSKSKQSFYDSSKPFTCLDGSRAIPYDHVNDDFCDCPDGSDEPGTPACSSLGGKFHCANKGHKPVYIPSSRVNDGICDCCDGSDEYDGRVQCSDACKELGAQAREEAKRLAEVQQKGYEMRQDYSKQGTDKQEERRVSLAELEATLKEHQAESDRLKALKEEAETPETEAKDAHKSAWEAKKVEEGRVKAEAAFRAMDTDSDGSLTVVEIQARAEFDKDNSGDISEDEAKEWLGGETARDMEHFVVHLWKTISDVYVDPEAAIAEQAAPSEATPAEGEVPPAEEPPKAEEKSEGESALPPPVGDDTSAGDDDDVMPPHHEHEEIPTAEYADDQDNVDDDDDDDYSDEDFDEYERNVRHTPVGSREEEGMPEYDEATQGLIKVADEARNAFNGADKQREDVQRQIDDIRKQLEVDLGANNEFQPMQGNCYDFTDREYTYSVCPFNRVSQKPKNGGSETSLGSWGKWDGPGGNKYTVMKFENGQNCWNGPNRSGTVKMRCGENNELISASEPNRCEYHFELITPAVCEPPPPPKAGGADVHEEL